MRHDRTSRRSLLAALGASIGIASGGRGVSVASAEPPDELARRSVPYGELTFSVDGEASALAAPPMGRCLERNPAIHHEGTVYLAEEADVQPESPLVASHEGTKIPSGHRLEFAGIPLEATAEGHLVTIPGSSAPEVEFRARPEEASITVAGETQHVESRGELSSTVEIGVDTDAYEADSVTTELQVRYHGVTDVLSHPHRTVIPRTEETERALETVSVEPRRPGSQLETDSRYVTGGEEQRRPVRVTEVPAEDCYLIDSPEGGEN